MRTKTIQRIGEYCYNQGIAKPTETKLLRITENVYTSIAIEAVTLERLPK